MFVTSGNPIISRVLQFSLIPVSHLLSYLLFQPFTLIWWACLLKVLMYFAFPALTMDKTVQALKTNPSTWGHASMMESVLSAFQFLLNSNWLFHHILPFYWISLISIKIWCNISCLKDKTKFPLDSAAPSNRCPFLCFSLWAVLLERVAYSFFFSSLSFTLTLIRLSSSLLYRILSCDSVHAFMSSG